MNAVLEESREVEVSEIPEKEEIQDVPNTVVSKDDTQKIDIVKDSVENDVFGGIGNFQKLDDILNETGKAKTKDSTGSKTLTPKVPRFMRREQNYSNKLLELINHNKQKIQSKLKLKGY